MNPETLKMMKAMNAVKPTDTRDLSAEDANAIEMHKAWIARDDDPDAHAPGDNGIRAGKAGAALARVWKCSEEEA
jgi:hypothetical protein